MAKKRENIMDKEHYPRTNTGRYGYLQIGGKIIRTSTNKTKHRGKY